VPEGSEKPSSNGEVLDFVIKSLRLGAEDVSGVGQNPSNDGIIYVKFYKEETMTKTMRSAGVRTLNLKMEQLCKWPRVKLMRTLNTFESLDYLLRSRIEKSESFSNNLETRLVKERYPSQYNFDV
jgi:hypothetical protein